MRTKEDYYHLVQRITGFFKEIHQVEAVALAGSLTSSCIDDKSDIDLYVYINEEIPVSKRLELIEKIGASRAELDNRYWDIGDEWIEKESKISVDMIYWHTCWIEEQLFRTLDRKEAWVGYSTCHWHTVRNSEILWDRAGWFQKILKKSMTDYPEILRKNIILKNYPLLMDAIPSYLNQIEKALVREDIIALNHRAAAYLASYFDIIFAVNRIPNPGEKRMLKNVKNLCSLVPEEMEKDISCFIFFSANCDMKIIELMNLMGNKIKKLLIMERLL